MAPIDSRDTIAAIASPPGPALRGIVRLSGPGAITIALDLVRINEGNRSDDRRPSWRSGAIDLDGLPLDASVAFWPGMRTYTGQPMAEIHTTGSPPLLRAVLARCLARGSRLAGPGEFTLRAFLSGRIDLTRAEAVLAVIHSDSPAQVEAALRQLAGGLASPIEHLRDRLLDTLAHLEAGLDFVDEADVDPIGRKVLADGLEHDANELATLAGKLKGRDRPSGLPRVVLVGPPNAGKSRLFNALLGGEFALVSPVAGTTRDYLSAPIDCDGLRVDLIDTAGIDDSADPIEAQAQALRAAQAAGADLLLDCQPADAPPVSSATTDGRPRLFVRTKADHFPAAIPGEPDPRGGWGHPDPSLAGPGPWGPPSGPQPPRHGGGTDPGSSESPGSVPECAIATSAATGIGLDALRLAIAAALRAQAAEADPTALTSARCRDGIVRASSALARASDSIRLESGDELVAVDLREAVEELGRIIGAEIDDGILDRIFRRFCIGK